MGLFCKKLMRTCHTQDAPPIRSNSSEHIVCLSLPKVHLEKKDASYHDGSIQQSISSFHCHHHFIPSADENHPTPITCHHGA
mmetsp:Transcript_38399/g.71043  ORF Transcript_38399/g.71043 Transcript_38399/m.71043 type:complete len:82 (-) Transcript_38399:2642-2887(-)